MEMNEDDNNALYNQIKYLTFNEQKKILDLSLCDKINTNIYYCFIVLLSEWTE